MGIPGDRDEERQGGWQSEWQSGGWQSQWQPPGGAQGGWQQQEQQPAAAQPGSPSGWQQTPDGRWVQTGATASSGKSTAALVMGILGLFLCPLVFSVLALVFGYQSRREIDASGGRLSGRGNATAGVVLGWIGVTLWAIFIVLLIIGLIVGDTSSGGGPGSGVPA